MQKNIKPYILIWTILLVVFNAVVFLVRPVFPGYVIHYDARFWVAWVFIIAAYIGNLVCANLAFQSENLKKLFYNMPLITVCRATLIGLTIIGCAMMLIPDCPAWITAIVCILILAFNATAVVKAAWAADAVETIDDKVLADTSFIQDLTSRAETLMKYAKSPDAKTACKKVYEAVRFSDPISSPELSVIEAKITVKMDEFNTLIENENSDGYDDKAAELVSLIQDRNMQCRRMK